MGLAAALLGWQASRAAILFADGLRYVQQAQLFEQGSWRAGLKAVDHPIYPISIAAAHFLLGGEGPEAYQRAGQAAAIVAGVLLVVPLYLVSCEVFGPTGAWLACVLSYFVPLTGHVFADTLSESTFLLFWTWGLWAAIRFLREGTFAWLPPMIGFSGLAYLSRPEGLLLPAAVVASLFAMPILRSTRLNWPRWWAAIGFLVLGPACLIGPYVAAKGGLGTKPAIARVLGTAPKAPASAVERQRPLDVDQSSAKTYGLAAKAVFEAVREATSLPLLGLATVGFALAPRKPGGGRVWLLLAIIATASVLALIRLHVTGGYCSPRHAMILQLLLIPASAHALHRGLSSIAIPGRWLGLDDEPFRVGPAVWVGALALLGILYVPRILVPINDGYSGYRDAGSWVASHVPPESRVVDVSGWALYYGRRGGYTFANIHEMHANPDLRWVVVREAHLRGPWDYCRQLRGLVAGRAPTISFPEVPTVGKAQIHVFDLQVPPIPGLETPILADRRPETLR